jgi:hypothetical protein
MRRIDAFAHILPAGYVQHLERHLASTMRPDRLRYYQEGVFPAGLSAAELAAVYAGNAQRLLGVR